MRDGGIGIVVVGTLGAVDDIDQIDAEIQLRSIFLVGIGIDDLPSIPQDNTDRNRTSPMAFTGNKFEFRMLGSAQSISGPNIALNTIMAQELKEFADKLEKSKNFNADLQKLIKKTFTDHQRIIFNGNGYDESWVKEATKRGLSNHVCSSTLRRQKGS